MSSNEPQKSRDEIKAAREAKKLAKQKVKAGNAEKIKTPTNKIEPADRPSEQASDLQKAANLPKPIKDKDEVTPKPGNLPKPIKDKDEVDRAVAKTEIIGDVAAEKSREDIKSERAAKKQEKKAKKVTIKEPNKDVESCKENVPKSCVETISDIVEIAKEVQDVTAKVNAFLLKVGVQQPEESGKSKAELKAERRAKQEAQRAAKQAQQTVKIEAQAAKTPLKAPPAAIIQDKEPSPKPKPLMKTKSKLQVTTKDGWFQHLQKAKNENPLSKVPLNSNLHPSIIRLGVQLASRVVSGSNARCIALLDALKKMVSDYTLPAKTEFARGLEAHLASSMEYLASMRPLCASQTNALKYFRYHLTQLPNNVDEFDAKKCLQEEIDRYIHEQIDMAGEAISIAVRNKIADGDRILTYGFSSLIERILREAWAAGVKFRALIVGNGVTQGGREMLRRLNAHGVACTYVDVTAIHYCMPTVSKVLLGASALLSNGSVLGAAGTGALALAARDHNVPVLVCCETHKFSHQVHTDAFVYNELGNPDDLLQQSQDESPLKDWRNNPNLTLLNLTYDVTPPSLVTAVVTELAVLPCTSAPVVLRFKLSEYGV